MKKVLKVLIVFGLVFVNSSLVFAEDNDESVSTYKIQELELTKEQKAELDKLYDELLVSHKKIINKYVEYGVITQEKGDFIISRIKERHDKIREDDYIPKRKKLKQRGNNKIFKQE